jgi:hypothetical protein
MSAVNVQNIQGANQLQPLLQETTDLLNSVQTRAFELFQRRGGFAVCRRLRRKVDVLFFKHLLAPRLTLIATNGHQV